MINFVVPIMLTAAYVMHNDNQTVCVLEPEGLRAAAAGEE